MPVHPGCWYLAQELAYLEVVSRLTAATVLRKCYYLYLVLLHGKSYLGEKKEKEKKKKTNKKKSQQGNAIVLVLSWLIVYRGYKESKLGVGPCSRPISRTQCSTSTIDANTYSTDNHGSTSTSLISNTSLSVLCTPLPHCIWWFAQKRLAQTPTKVNYPDSGNK